MMLDNFITKEEKIEKNSTTYQEIILCVKRYCPLLAEIQFDIYLDRKQFFNDYYLLLLVDNHSKHHLFGFYNKFDFHPLQFDGKPLKKLSSIHGILKENVWGYFELQLSQLAHLSKGHPDTIKFPVLISNENKADFENSSLIKEALEHDNNDSNEFETIQHALVYNPNSTPNTSFLKVFFDNKNDQYEIKPERTQIVGRFNESFWDKKPHVIS